MTTSKPVALVLEFSDAAAMRRFLEDLEFHGIGDAIGDPEEVVNLDGQGPHGGYKEMFVLEMGDYD